MKEYKSTILLAIAVALIMGCRDVNPKGLFKFYEGAPIGDVLYFEHNKHHLLNDSIFFKDEPIGILISTKRRLDGERFITVKDLNSNRQATYINK